MRTHISKKGGVLIAAVVALSVIAASFAHAEVVEKGRYRISFHGSIAPVKLPRKGLAPVGVTMGAKIKTTDEEKPARLNKIVLDINSHGTFDNKGLPLCNYGALVNASPEDARRACGAAEVGHGNVTTRIGFPGQGEFAANGPLLAFNGKEKGKQAIFAYVDSEGKFSTTFVIKFIVKKTHGTYGTSLVADVPSIASGNGYISAFDLGLKRKYSFKGQKKSFVAASCPLPAGVNIASFGFARSTYSFEDGTTVSSVQKSTCKAKN